MAKSRQYRMPEQLLRGFEHVEVAAYSDSVDLVVMSEALYIGGAGNVAVITAGGDAVTFTAPPIGTVLPMRVSRVKSTGTTVGAGLILSLS